MSSTSNFSCALIALPTELLESILCYFPPPDLISFGQTCRFAHSFIQPDNKLLWKCSFMQVFDDPKYAWNSLQPTARAANRQRESQWDWFQEARKRYSVIHSVPRKGNVRNVKSIPSWLSAPEDVVPVLLDVFETASFSEPQGTSASHEDNKRTSLNLDFLSRFFSISQFSERIVHDYHHPSPSTTSSPLISDISSPSPPGPITRSMVAKKPVPEWASRFHVYYGQTSREENSIRAKAAARALVYDWRITGPEADYGPFKNDGSGEVNWEALEGITSLMNRIFEGNSSAQFRTPSTLRDYVPYTLSQDPTCREDWAGVTRPWVGTYAFLDYRALVRYNFANLEYPMDLGGHEEACGDIMELLLELDDSEDLREDPKLKTHLPICKDLPMLYFTGTSSGYPHGRPTVLVRGIAALAPGGREVRWRFVISYAGADQWQLEGVQPGIRCGGVFGIWTHVEHDDDHGHGPQGPFCYFPMERCLIGYEEL